MLTKIRVVIVRPDLGTTAMTGGAVGGFSLSACEVVLIIVKRTVPTKAEARSIAAIRVLIAKVAANECLLADGYDRVLLFDVDPVIWRPGVRSRSSATVAGDRRASRLAALGGVRVITG